MKIEIEWSSSISASLKIAGRELRVEIKPVEGMTCLEGVEEPELDSTFGGLLAQVLYPLIGAAMQAECIAVEEMDCSGETDVTWESLPEDTSLAVEMRLS